MNIKFIKNKSRNYVRRREYSSSKNNIKNISIIVLYLFFLLGLFMGILYFKNVNNSNYFGENTNILENIDLNSLNYEKMFSESIFRNITTLLFMWIIGLSILGTPILIFYLLYDGFSLGFTISYIITSYGFYKGYLFIGFNMYITTIINTAMIILLCNSALKVTINILKQKTSLKSEFIRHSIVCIITLILLIISSIIEVNLTKFV